MADPTATGLSSRLQYRGADSTPLVLAGGIITTCIALTLVWLANQHGENIMGWYADYVLPAGAILIGLVASSGYGTASYVTGTRVTGRLLGVVLVLLVVGYFVAQYVEYRLAVPATVVKDDGSPLTFFAYFDAVTRSFYWKAEHGGDQDGSALGAWGYLLRLGEIVGFAAGGLVIPLVLRKVPYCTHCGIYKKTHKLAFFAAGVPVKRVRKPEAKAAYEQADAEVRTQGEAILAAMMQAAAQDDAHALAAEVGKHTKLGNYAAQKLTSRILVSLVRCPRCNEGALKAARQTGRGNQIRTTPIAEQPISASATVEYLRLERQGLLKAG